MRIAHLADTHIKNLKYHYEYKKVFEKLYSHLREQKVDYIVHCGDLAHTKTQISPEFVEMCSNFLSSLAAIAPTYIILGNHDGNLRNSNRQDAITPIVDALQNPNLHLLKKSGEVLLDNNLALNVLSIFDEENWVEPSDKDRINIALYHGAIKNSCTDTGWAMDYGDHELSIFEGFDYALLGDIHKTNQALDEEGKVRYAGSTIQQNHGETNDKGFLLWDITDKESFTCEHITLKNPKPFITVELTPKGRIPKNTQVAEGGRLRLVSNNNLPLDVMRKAVDVAKVRYKPETITFLNRAAGVRGDVDEIVGEFGQEDLRNVGVQEELISEYLKDYQVNSETMDKVFELNRKYNVLVESQEEISRNVNWKLDSIEWGNLFNYDEGNKVDFNKLNGIVGIFGKNFSGKSSIIDSMLYTMFNSTSKKERKNLNIINQTKEFCHGKLNITIGNKQYTIGRRSEKYIKRLKGEETLEAKTDVDFDCYDTVLEESQSLNGITRNETDKNIRKLFGSMDDFLLTSMASQLESLAFIGEGSTRRKEILAKFLDLEFFDVKFRLAKEDASNHRGAIKRLEGRDFDAENGENRELLGANEKTTESHRKLCEKLKRRRNKKNNALLKVNNTIESIPAEIIDIKEVRANIAANKIKHQTLVSKEEEIATGIKKRQKIFKKIEEFLQTLDVNELQETQALIDEQQTSLKNIKAEIKNYETLIGVQEKKTSLLQEVPCGSEYSHCKFICDAYAATDKLVANKDDVATLKSKSEKIKERIFELKPESVGRYIEQHRQIAQKKQIVSKEVVELQLQSEKNKNDQAQIIKAVEEHEAVEQEYANNKDAIENKEEFLIKKSSILLDLDGLDQDIATCEEDMLQLYKEHGSLEQQVRHLEEQKQELADLQREYSAYDLFMRCMHSGGISYDIIKRKLPFINNEIAKVLANIVNFEVFLENDGRSLNINIKHPRFEARPLSMCSGAEKTIAAMAIRLALLSVSNLPKGDVFIMDEPGTALDENNMEGFVRILELVKTYFKTVLLISHLDSLKDCVDMQIVIERREGFAHVEV